jgi:hypothetical protein
MHPAKDYNVEHLKRWFQMLEINGSVEKVGELHEDETGYSIKVKPTIWMRPMWHFRIYMEEKV